MNTATQLTWTTAFAVLALAATGATHADAAQVRAMLSSREAYVASR